MTTGVIAAAQPKPSHRLKPAVMQIYKTLSRIQDGVLVNPNNCLHGHLGDRSNGGHGHLGDRSNGGRNSGLPTRRLW